MPPILQVWKMSQFVYKLKTAAPMVLTGRRQPGSLSGRRIRSEEHTSELQSLTNLVCRLLLEKKKETCRGCHHRPTRGRRRPRPLRSERPARQHPALVRACTARTIDSRVRDDAHRHASVIDADLAARPAWASTSSATTSDRIVHVLTASRICPHLRAPPSAARTTPPSLYVPPPPRSTVCFFFLK